MSDEINITGLVEVQKALYDFGNQLGDKVIRAALRVGANYVVKQIRIAAPKKTGRLRRAVRVSTSRINNGKNGVLGVYINIRKSKKSGAWYGRLQEDGYTAVGRPRTVVRVAGARRGNSRTQRQGRLIPGKKFMKNTFNENREAAVQLIVQAAERGAEILAARLGFQS